MFASRSHNAFRFFLGSLALFAGVGLQQALADVTIQTTDGREIVGQVDERTDQNSLWIRQEREQIMLTTALKWSEIATASDGEVELPLEQLPDLLQELASEEPKGLLVRQTIYPDESLCPDCESREPDGLATQRRATRIRNVEVEAHLVNLDRDVEPDGLELVVAAIDENGYPVPVRGSLYVRLWGERIKPRGALVRYEQLQQWTQRVDRDDFIEDVASYLLRFRTVQPEFDLGLSPDALVHVKLSVFGQGSYEASVPVMVRKFNPVRDRLQLTRGERFFPNESTQNGRYQLPQRRQSRAIVIR